jgi:hypothetical protein|tara:strand:- start:62 stop:1015 length:954 start_codon:yes stop_codon:yes gene_type:complete
MGFLDNSGDIILDAVLTDTGRFRLSKGDGSFKIAKFALGDDEINYGTYYKNHASGSAYYDLEILQTPVFEAFTNNTSLMKSKLLSIPRNNLMYLPIVKINNSLDVNNYFQAGTSSLGNLFLVTVDNSTEQLTTAATPGIMSTTNSNNVGIIKGFNVGSAGNNSIRVDQGLDTTEISADFDLDSDLIETQYIIEMDNRFGSLAFPNGSGIAPVSFIDDDQVATYYVSMGSLAGGNFITKNNAGSNTANQVISGPRGTSLSFRVKASLELASSTYLFTVLGSTSAVNSTDVLHIDTTIRITGATTGYRLDIPVRYVKKQ